MAAVFIAGEKTERGITVQKPYELVTLMALIKHNVKTYLLLAVTHAVAEFTGRLLPGDPHRPFVPGMTISPEHIKLVMTLLRSEPAVAEMPLITKQIDRVLSIIERENSKPYELTTEVKNLFLRLDDLFAGQTFYLVFARQGEELRRTVWRMGAHV